MQDDIKKRCPMMRNKQTNKQTNNNNNNNNNKTTLIQKDPQKETISATLDR